MKWEINVVFMKAPRGMGYNWRFQDTFSTNMMHPHRLGQQVGYREVSPKRRRKKNHYYLSFHRKKEFRSLEYYFIFSATWYMQCNIIQVFWWVGFCLLVYLILCDNSLANALKMFPIQLLDSKDQVINQGGITWYSGSDAWLVISSLDPGLLL